MTTAWRVARGRWLVGGDDRFVWQFGGGGDDRFVWQFGGDGTHRSDHISNAVIQVWVRHLLQPNVFFAVLHTSVLFKSKTQAIGAPP